MSLESAREFMKQLIHDVEMSAKVAEAESLAGKMAVAQAAEFDFSFEELIMAYEELSEAELDFVVRGAWNPDHNNDEHYGKTWENYSDPCVMGGSLGA